MRFLSFALGANQSGAASCKPLRHRPCSKGCLFGARILQTGFVGNRFAISRLRHGARSVASSFLQAASASALLERVLGRSICFANRFCWEPVLRVLGFALGGHSVGICFLQTPSAPTLVERLLGPSIYFANQFCWGPVCGF